MNSGRELSVQVEAEEHYFVADDALVNCSFPLGPSFQVEACGDYSYEAD
jgi:hypothetical protein